MDFLAKFVYEHIWLPRGAETTVWERRHHLYRRHKLSATSSNRVQPSHLTHLTVLIVADFGTVEPRAAWA